MSLRVLSLFLALLAVGCGPYMHTDTVRVLAYQAPERCGQGPYEIVVPAQGARWGEGIRVLAYSPHTLEGRYEIEANGAVAEEGMFTQRQVPTLTSSSSSDDYVLASAQESLDNSRCLAAGAERALESSGGGAVIADVPRAEAEVAIGVPEGEAHTVSLELREVALPERIDLSFPEMRERHVGVIRMGNHVWSARDPENDPSPPLAEGTPMRIRFWSNAPNVLEGVTFVIAHLVQRPSVPDEQWIAHLRAEREARAREDRARHEAEQRRLDAWRAHCDAHHEDEQCWGPGGYDAAVRRSQRAESTPRRAEPEWVEPPPSAPSPPREPEGPPPPPRAELRPPRPSANATWTPGYWHWHAARWVWIGGSWEVPAEDLEREETVRAPAPPPPPQVEVQAAAPAPGMVWVPGYWQWDGARFVWIGGRWDLPRPGASWQPPSWRPRAGGAVFVPGRWEIRIGR